MGGEIVWGNQTDSFALSHWAFVIIVATAIVYDLLLHKLPIICSALHTCIATQKKPATLSALPKPT